MSDDNVIPLRPVPDMPPRSVLSAVLMLGADGKVAITFPDGNPLTVADTGDLLLRAVYSWHLRHLNGMAAVVITADHCNVYHRGGSIPWSRKPKAWLRRRFDDVYLTITGRPRNLLHWLRRRRSP